MEPQKIANDQQTTQIYNLLQQCKDSDDLKMGANEVTKALNKGKAQLVVMASDTLPPEIIAHLPILCEDKNVSYLYVASKAALGKACGISRSVIAVAIASGTEISANRNEKGIRKILSLESK